MRVVMVTRVGGGGGYELKYARCYSHEMREDSELIYARCYGHERREDSELIYAALLWSRGWGWGVGYELIRVSGDKMF